ncbi:hypothetical protein QFZ82_002178 [Streptomyces sp. V4I23]|nr:hypothetical protein [Streptomyces sp. V4I23]
MSNIELAEALDQVLADLDSDVPQEWLESRIETATAAVSW